MGPITGFCEPTHIVLTQMHALRPNGESDIHTIVNEQWDAIALGDLMQLSSCVDQDAGIASLIPFS